MERCFSERCAFMSWMILYFHSNSGTSAFTISGNGTGTDGAMVSQGDNLKLTFSASRNDILYVEWYSKPRGNSSYPVLPLVAMKMDSGGTCRFNPTYPVPANIKCDCVNISQYTCTLISVQTDMKGDMWRCGFSYGTQASSEYSYTNNLTIGLTVGITSTEISSPIANPVSVIVNTAGTFQCQTSPGNPLATVVWYKDNKTPTTGDDTQITSGTNNSSTPDGDLFITHATLTIQVQKDDQDMGVYCLASNGGQWFTSGTKQIDVLYGPDRPACTAYTVNVSPSLRVIVGNTFSITCTADSIPPPNTYLLSGPGGNNLQLNFTDIARTQTGTYTMEAMNSMSASGSGSSVTGRNSTSFTIDVLYTPSKPTIRMDGRAVQGTVDIIEGNSKVFNCSTDSIPASSYSWTYPRGSKANSLLQVDNFLPDADDGDYTCKAQNKMVPSFGSFQNGVNMTTITVNVLYGPKMRIIQNVSLVQGENIVYPCFYEPGNPPSVSFEWSRSGTTANWTKQNTQNLTILNVQRSDEASYTCNVSSVLRPTLTTATTVKYDTATFYLDVLYGAENLQLLLNNVSRASVEIEEHSTNTLKCSVESDPASDMTIDKKGKTILKRHGVHQLIHEIKAECVDTGVYTCSAYNQYGTANNASVRILVKCSARLGTNVVLNYYARQHENVTMSLTIVAYPVPEPSQFVWKGCSNECEGSCNTLSVDMLNFDIKTEDLNSYLTIRDVKLEDYGVYQFSVFNGIGSPLLEWMHLKPIGKPDVPTDFHVIQTEISETSAVLTWVPGFDNGSPQTFCITYVSIGDNSKFVTQTTEHNDATKMNFTLINLESESEYIVSIYAYNKEGSSPTTSDTFITLKHIPADIGASPAQIIGGSIAGSIIAIVVVVVIVIIMRRKYILDCTFKISLLKREDAQTRQHVRMYENPGNNSATYEAVSGFKDTALVYDALNNGSEGADTSHVYIPLDESQLNPIANNELSKPEDPVYNNTMHEKAVRTVL